MRDKSLKQIVEKIERLVFSLRDLVEELESLVLTLSLMTDDDEDEKRVVVVAKDGEELRKALDYSEGSQ